MNMRILGVSVDNLGQKEILARVEKFLDEPKFHQIATVNPEFLLEAEKNKDFQTALEQCDLRIADGFGITLVFFFQGERLKCRFPGADLTEIILQRAKRKNLGIYLAIKKNGLSSFEEIKKTLLKKYPRLIINGTDIDPKIHNSQFLIPDSIVFCNFGSPQQEIFLNNLKNQGNIRLAMGVGGSFDYLTGKLERAPKVLRSLGLEWLWRLIQQPKRWKRIWNATIAFPFRVIFATIDK